MKIDFSLAKWIFRFRWMSSVKSLRTSAVPMLVTVFFAFQLIGVGLDGIIPQLNGSGYLVFFAPAFILSLAFCFSFWESFSNSVYSRSENSHCFSFYQRMGFPRASQVLGEVLWSSAKSLVLTLLLMFFTLVFWASFSVSFHFSILFWLSLILLILNGGILGYFLGVMIKSSHISAKGMAVFFLTVMVLSGGVIFPTSIFENPIFVLLQLNPLKQGVDLARASLVYGASWLPLIGPTGILVLQITGLSYLASKV